MILATRHTGIVVADMDKMLRFWRDIMGLEVVADFYEQGEYIRTVQNLPGVKLHMLKLQCPDGTLLELLKDEGNPTPPPERNRLCDRGIRHIAFTVANIREAYVQMEKHGCETLSKPVESPDGKAMLFFARDPEGNLLELVQILG